MGYSLGADIGSASAKLVLIEDGGRLAYLGTEKITSNAKEAVNSLLAELAQQFSLAEVAAAGVTGSARDVIPLELHWSQHSSSLAVASGLLHSHPDAKTIIQIGGQSSLIVGLEDGLNKPWKVVTNPLCAAGTGRFLEQQAYRLGIRVEDLGPVALQFKGAAPRIAARCSVFAKSDLIHLQQKGVPVEAMLYALCESIARMVVGLQKGPFGEPIFFVGGVASNGAMVKALNEALSTRNGHPVSVTVPENHVLTAAIGAALLARGRISRVALLAEPQERQSYYESPSLPKVRTHIPAAAKRIEAPCTGYLGVDVGSTSTKAVILDASGNILAKNYLMTAGRPVDAVKQLFRNLLRDGADHVTVAGAGVTGSGRYLIGSLIGADMVKNEITAQTRAAMEIDPEADIIEIGGQDSKLVIKRNQVVVDYQMNKACAAGTGSFIDELAEGLGVSVKDGEFADLAFEAPHTCDLGTRCAAFMSQAVASAQQEGMPLNVITASLSNSIAKNYLSKVVGTRKLGKKVILTGAVFYNQAVVSAFTEQLEDNELVVAEHREVTGAIGAALLAREALGDQPSKFKGFQNVIASECSLSTFTCKVCDNNCAITRMLVPNEKPTFFGSRCDLFDGTLGKGKTNTAFDEREKLLLSDLRESTITGPTVGIPRALLVYDYAPLLIGFLNALGVRVALSNRTTQEIIEQAVEMGHADSCFPIKLLHGHVASLSNSDFILFPSAIRLGKREGDEDQKYACPLVQASPYIVRQTLGLKDRLLIPTIDFSQGDSDTLRSLTEIGVRMGFRARRSRQAAMAGIAAQRHFESGRVEAGASVLAELRETGKLGVVLLSRAYNSQDSGANLGIAEKLAQLGVVPVPLDFLPLDSVDAKKFTDRPYWAYESKLIAGAAITASDPSLYGLVLTNFGCGPNSFILRILEDIMGNKPLGQLEIDEHAAEAGLVTRLEAFVDTIQAHARSGKHDDPGRPYIYRGTTALNGSRKTILLPHMGPFVHAIAAAMEAYGVKTMVLPEPDERNLLYANQVTSGAECLPYRVTLGDFMKVAYANGQYPKDIEVLMAGSFGPCRFGKYVTEQMRILKGLGFELPIRTTVSNNAYSDLGLGQAFERLAWKGLVAVDCLERLLWRSRPYERRKGSADALFKYYLGQVADHIQAKGDTGEVLEKATRDFQMLADDSLPRRPLVGINGEIYLRSNSFANCNLIRECEDAGLEVLVSPMAEWIKYISHRNIEDAIHFGKIGNTVKGYMRKIVQDWDERSVTSHCRSLLPEREPSTAELLAKSSEYLSSKCGSEAVLSIGSGLEWLESHEFAGVISVMPHGCMPGEIVASMSERFSASLGKPWISLTYDGFLETNNRTKISEFAELVRFRHARTAVRHP